MNILLTGANGYIGLRLLPNLLEAGHTIYALVRDRQRMPVEDFSAYGERLQILEADLAELSADFSLPSEIDVAYFLVHSMGGGGDFSAREAVTAEVFLKLLQPTKCAQIIYLGGIVPQSGQLSEHLESRRNVAEILGSGSIPLTTLRASIIVGSGSASFEIIRDLVEKLPVMITPRWTQNKCQPIAIRNVINYLQQLAGKSEAYGRSFDIGGPEVLTYRALLEEYAQARQLKRWVVPVPLLRLKLSSYWLYFMTSTTFSLARALVESLAHDTICQNDDIRKLVPQELLTYREAIEMAFARIAQNRVPSSWYNALASGTMSSARLKSIHVPEHGVLRDSQTLPIQSSREEVIRAVWSLGGAAGWPSMNWAWRVRGDLDRLVGGIGVRRGRRDPTTLRAGDAVDFWRVLMADRPHGRLILYAEMKLPGEGWLEFEITDKEIHQTATFRPLGLWGRLYWVFCLPFHWWLFRAWRGDSRRLCRSRLPRPRRSAPRCRRVRMARFGIEWGGIGGSRRYWCACAG